MSSKLLFASYFSCFYLISGCTNTTPRDIYHIDPGYDVHAVMEERTLTGHKKHFAYSNLPGEYKLPTRCQDTSTPILEYTHGSTEVRLSLSPCIPEESSEALSRKGSLAEARIRPLLRSFDHFLGAPNNISGKLASIRIIFTPNNHRVQHEVPIHQTEGSGYVLTFLFQVEKEEENITLDLGRAIGTSLHELVHLMIRRGHLPQYDDEVREEFAINLLIRCVRVSGGLPIDHETSAVGGTNELSLPDALNLYQSGEWSVQGRYPGDISKPLSREYLIDRIGDNDASSARFDEICQAALNPESFDDALSVLP